MDGCGFVWLRNDGDRFSRDAISPNSSSSSVPIKLPRINWSEGAAGPDVVGESCSLTGQVTKVRNTEPDNMCADRRSTQLVYNFMDVNSDGLPDLVAALHYDEILYKPENDATWYPTAGTLHNTTDGSIDEIQGVGGDMGTWWCRGDLEHESARDGKFKMYWYENKGPAVGFFDLTEPKFISSPIPLNANVGSSTPLSAAYGYRKSLGSSTFTDINGDGNIDAIWSDGYNNAKKISGGQTLGPASPTTIRWSVHLGDGEGSFYGPPDDPLNLPYPWEVPGDAQISMETRGLDDGEAMNYSLSELVDVNADGLDDLVYWFNENLLTLNVGSFTLNGSSRIYLNNGQGFEHVNGVWNQPKLTDDPDRPGSTTSMSAFKDNAGLSGAFLNAVGNSRIRFSDFDSDGRPDLLSLQELLLPWETYVPAYGVASDPKIYINPGMGTLLTPPIGSSSSVFTGPDVMQHGVVLRESEWEVSGDFIDLNGDGEPETVTPTYSKGSGFFLMSRDTAEQPLRLLNQIDNGNGGITEIRYAAHNDPSVATDSQADYAVMPRHIWVVKEVTSTDTIGGVTGVSDVKYGTPVWNQDTRGDWGFRGFDSMETSSIHDVGATTGFSVTEKKYGYDVDWSGRVEETRVTADGALASVATNFWVQRDLFGGASKSFHNELSQRSVCEGTCLTTYVRRGFVPLVSADLADGIELAWVTEESNTQQVPGTVETKGDLRNVLSYELHSSASKYWLLQTESNRSVFEPAPSGRIVGAPRDSIFHLGGEQENEIWRIQKSSKRTS